MHSTVLGDALPWSCSKVAEHDVILNLIAHVVHTSIGCNILEVP